MNVDPIAHPTGASSASSKKSALGGLLVCRERWGLTLRGWLFIATAVIAVGMSFVLEIRSFLAPTERVPAHLLVVEGWSPPSTMKTVAAEFRSGSYDQVILVRPVLDVADQYESGRYVGHWLTRLLVAEGIPDAKLATLFPNVAYKDRTYHAALAVKEWVSKQHLNIDALNLATTGPHARRSRLLYEKAFGPTFNVGVIAMESTEYQPGRWWRTSAGVRDVIGESIAYAYARVFFHPSEMDSNDHKSESHVNRSIDD